MHYFGWSEEKVRKRITGAQGWAYYFWATAQESAGWMQPPLESINGYIAQDIKSRILK